MMTPEQMQEALYSKLDRDSVFSDADAELITDSWHEFLQTLTPEQQRLSLLWDTLTREFVRGKRCGVCLKAGDPGCITGC